MISCLKKKNILLVFEEVNKKCRNGEDFIQGVREQGDENTHARKIIMILIIPTN